MKIKTLALIALLFAAVSPVGLWGQANGVTPNVNTVLNNYGLGAYMDVSNQFARPIIGLDGSNIVRIDYGAGGTRFGGNVTVDGTTTFSGGTTFSGNITVGGTFAVTGTSAFTGAATFNGGLSDGISQFAVIFAGTSGTFAGDATNFRYNFNTRRLTVDATDGVIIGRVSSGIGGVYSAGVTPSGSNYGLALYPTETDLNAPGASNSIYVTAGGSAFLQMNTTLGMSPSSDNAVPFGASNRRWTTGYTVTFQVGTTGTNGTLNTGGTIFASGLSGSASNQTTSLCLSVANEVIADTQVGGCLVSSKVFKHDIKYFDEELKNFSATNLLLKFRPGTYVYNNDGLEKNRQDWSTHYGLFAEDVDQLERTTKLPASLVNYDLEGNPHGIQYELLPPVLIQGFKEHDARIVSLEERIAVLEAR